MLAADIGTVLDLAEIGIKWREDSSIERWFPMSAAKLAYFDKQNVQSVPPAERKLTNEIKCL